MGPFPGGHNPAVVEVISPPTIVRVRPVSLITNPEVEHGIVPWSVFRSKDHMVTLPTSQRGRSVPVNPSHRRVNTAAGA